MEREAYLHKERAPVLDRPVAACMLCGQAGKDIFEAHVCTSISGQETLSQNPSQRGVPIRFNLVGNLPTSMEWREYDGRKDPT